MDLAHFFTPVSIETRRSFYPSKPDNLGIYIDSYQEDDVFPDWSEADIVLFGTTEERGGYGAFGCGEASNIIRSFLYELAPPSSEIKIADLGNLEHKENLEDLYFNLSFVTEQLLKKDKIIIFLGGTQDLTYGLYQAFEKFESPIEYVAIDPNLDIFDSEVELNSVSFNHKILVSDSRYLDHLSILAVQSYLLSNEEKQIFEKLHLEYVRIGELHANMRLAEMYLRQAGLISFDMSAVRSADAPGASHPTPAGLTVEEACQIARYAGMGYNANCFHLSEINPSLDFRDQTSYLAALLAWFFIDGCYGRPTDRPKADRSNLVRYRVALHGPIKEIIFFKHELTERWWMEVPTPTALAKKTGRTFLIPCSEQDYDKALNDEIPDRWWLIHGKYD